MSELHHCKCGCHKFYRGYSRITCAICGRYQGELYENLMPYYPTIIPAPKMPPPAVEKVCQLSGTD